MSVIHDNWTQTGRRLDFGNGQKIWTGRVGQQNLFVTGSTYLPYRWRPVPRVLEFADCELRLRPTGPEFWRGGTMLVRIVPRIETFAGGQWTRPALSILRTDIEEVDALGPNAMWRGTIVLDSAVGVFALRLEVGGSHKVHLAHRFRAKTAGRHRATLEIPTTASAITRERRGPGGIIRPNTGFEFNGMYWRFDEKELPKRGLQIDPSRFFPTLLEKNYAIDEEDFLEPDTLGPVSIANDADDGDESSTTTWYSNGFYANGNLYWEGELAENLAHWIGLGWRAIDLNTASPGVASINAGTQITLVNSGDNSTPTNKVGNLRGVNAGGGTVWSSTNRPSQQTSTAANTAVTGSTANQNIACQTIVEEWVITEATSYEGAADEDMYFYLQQTDNAVGWWGATADYDGVGAGVEATLTIQYTPTAAGGFNPALSDLLNRRGVMNLGARTI